MKKVYLKQPLTWSAARPCPIYKKWQSCNSDIPLFEARKKIRPVYVKATCSRPCHTYHLPLSKKGKTQQGLHSKTTQKRFKTSDSCLLACLHILPANLPVQRSNKSPELSKFFPVAVGRQSKVSNCKSFSVEHTKVSSKLRPPQTDVRSWTDVFCGHSSAPQVILKSVE